MDVTCDRCGTDYEFEEALVSTRGTTVKCTQCGHLFKVYKPQAPVESTQEKHPWTVRRGDGSIHRLGSLADLTRLIGEAAFARDDEVSRTGKAWKKLGEIEELRDFFPGSDRPAQRRRRATVPELGLRASNPPPPQPQPTLPRGVGSVPPPTPTAPAAPSGPSGPPEPPAAGRARINTPRQPLRFESLGGEVDVEGRGRAGALHESDAGTAAAAPPSGAGSELDAAATSRLRAVTSEPAPARPTAAAREASTPSQRTPRSLSWVWALLVLGACAAIGGWLLWPTMQQRMHPAAQQDPTAEFVARGDAAFATHRIQHFQDAITEYVKALAFHESDPHILSSVSRVYAVWAQELVWKGKTLGAAGNTSKDLDRHSEALALDKEQRQLAEQAKRYGETAARKNPGNEEAEVALADALRLTGNLVAARSELDRARATESVASAETLRVAALLAVDEAGGDLRAGLKLASQAVAQEPECIRTRLLLARALVADADAAGARYHLNAVAMRDRSHPGIAAVEQELDRRAASASGSDAGTDAGSSAAAARKAAAAAELNEPMTYEAYIARGKAMLERGEVTTAQRLFEQALFVHPMSASAHIGLGYVALEKGRPALAIEHFLPATRAGNSEAFIGLGDAYRRMGKLREALRAYQSYLSHEPSGAQANIARTQIDRLNEQLGSAHSGR